MSNENQSNSPVVEDEIFSPLSANVKQRDYTHLDVNPNETFSKIPEPQFAKPSTEDLKRGLQEKLNENDGVKPTSSNAQNTGNTSNGPTSSDTSNGGFKAEPKGTANQFVSELDNSDKKKASQAVVDAVLDGYGIVNQYANKLIQYNPKKIDKLIREGELNENIKINVDNQQLPLETYIESYNNAAANTLFVSNDFKEKVSPVMLRVFMKRNIGMTDENLLAYYFGMDIVQKGIIVSQLRSQQNAILEQLKEMSKAMGPNTNYKSSNTSNTTNSTNASEQPVTNNNEPLPKSPSPTGGNSNTNNVEKMEINGDKGRVYETVTENTNSKREFMEVFEPDEIAPKVESEPFTDAVISDVKNTKIVDENPVTFIQPAMPVFGDKNILADMERKAANLNPKKARKNTKKP